MTNLSITMVKSEDDIIESFIRHNSTYIDIFVIVDNNSTDHTREILLKLQKEGFNIVIFDDPLLGRFQSEKTTFIYQRVVPIFKPQMVFLLDVDEFIIAPSRSYIENVSKNLPDKSIILVPWKVYVLSPENAKKSIKDPLREIQYRRKKENPPYYKSFIPTQPNLINSLVIEDGNHSCHLDTGEKLNFHIDNQIMIAHFPIRSSNQLFAKVILGWIDLMIRLHVVADRGYGYQQKLLYERYLKNWDLTAEELVFESCYYDQDRSNPEKFEDFTCHDPLPVSYELQYTDKVSSGISKIINGFNLIISGKNILPSEDLVKACQKNQINMDLPPFKYLIEKYTIESVLEFDFGTGAYLQFFEEQQLQKVSGVSKNFSDFSLFSGQCYKQNLKEKFSLDDQFDLVICTAFLDNLNVKQQTQYITNIVNHAKKYIIFSLKREDNRESLDTSVMRDFIEKFSQHNWVPHVFDSLALRSLSTLNAFQTQLIVFVPSVNKDIYFSLLLNNPINKIEPIAEPVAVNYSMAALEDQNPKIKNVQLFSELKQFVRNENEYEHLKEQFQLKCKDYDFLSEKFNDKCNEVSSITDVYNQKCIELDSMKEAYNKKCNDLTALTNTYHQKCRDLDSLKDAHNKKCIDLDSVTNVYNQKCSDLDSLKNAYDQKCIEFNSVTDIYNQKCIELNSVTDIYDQKCIELTSLTDAYNQKCHDLDTVMHAYNQLLVGAELSE
jgi:hypothetical protein